MPVRVRLSSSIARIVHRAMLGLHTTPTEPLLLIDDEVPSHANFDDAETLAGHAELPCATNAFIDYAHRRWPDELQAS